MTHRNEDSPPARSASAFPETFTFESADLQACIFQQQCQSSVESAQPFCDPVFHCWRHEPRCVLGTNGLWIAVSVAKQPLAGCFVKATRNVCIVLYFGANERCSVQFSCK